MAKSDADGFLPLMAGDSEVSEEVFLQYHLSGAFGGDVELPPEFAAAQPKPSPHYRVDMGQLWSSNLFDENSSDSSCCFFKCIAAYVIMLDVITRVNILPEWIRADFVKDPVATLKLIAGCAEHKMPADGQIQQLVDMLGVSVIRHEHDLTVKQFHGSTVDHNNLDASRVIQLELAFGHYRLMLHADTWFAGRDQPRVMEALRALCPREKNYPIFELPDDLKKWQAAPPKDMDIWKPAAADYRQPHPDKWHTASARRYPDPETWQTGIDQWNKIHDQQYAGYFDY